MSPLPRPPRRHPRRGLGLHRPVRPAPETPQEVLERAPGDVSRETVGGEYVAGGQVVPLDELVDELDAETPAPPLRRDQVIRLEALTAVWAREVRDAAGHELGPDDTVLWGAGGQPSIPVPPTRPRLQLAPPVPDAGDVAERSAELLADELAAETSSPAPAPVPGRVDQESAATPRRVSDWSSRHDPRSLEYAVRARLGRAVPLQDVELDAGPVLDQGTTPPLSPRDASACVGMALTTAANVLELRAGGAGDLDEDDARELYDVAQRHDHVHGEDYPGTSVLGGLLAGRAAGLWDVFLWALGGTKDIAQVLLQLGVAVVVGVPWDTALEEPDANGIVRPGGTPLGGHAIAVVGLRIQVAGRPGPWFVLQQSRGRGEGKGGRVFIHHRALAQLLAGVGEAGVPLPRDLT